MHNIMAKELPYFKFEPGEWESGNIQLLGYEQKGLFIEICSLYWMRTGELPYKLVLQKLCNGNANALDLLLEEEIIVLQEGQIVIDFLDEQLSEFANVSEKRSKAAKKRWSDTNAMQMQSKSNAIREEEKREKKNREKKKGADKSHKTSHMEKANEIVVMPYDSKKFIEAWEFWLDYKKNEHRFTYKSVKSEQVALKQLSELANNEQEAIKIIQVSIANGWKGLFKLDKNGKESNTDPRAEQYARVLAEMEREDAEAARNH